MGTPTPDFDPKWISLKFGFFLVKRVFWGVVFEFLIKKDVLATLKYPHGLTLNLFFRNILSKNENRTVS